MHMHVCMGLDMHNLHGYLWYLSTIHTNSLAKYEVKEWHMSAQQNWRQNCKSCTYQPQDQYDKGCKAV
jgi:hypothetical protein